MKILRMAMVIGVLSLAAGVPAAAQDDYSDLNIFGYLQAAYIEIPASFLGPRSTTFFLQQANIMGAKEFDSHFSAFLNLQFTNGFNSKLGWGNMNLEEGWAKYSYSHALNVKAGFLLPSFNSLLQVRNRTPLLPYILRPLVYEPLMTDRLNIDAFLPTHANLEVYGSVPVLPDVDVEYAAFVGNSETSYIISGQGAGFQVSGMDTSTAKLWGGRIGLSTHWIRGGVSMTTDMENQNTFGMGSMRRYRYGADLYVLVANVSFDGEVLFVRPSMSDRQKTVFAMVGMFNPMIGKDLDRTFLYGTLLWDISDAVYIYGSGSSLTVNDFKGMSEGVKEWTVGGGWRPLESIVVKAQYVVITCPSPYFPLDLGLPILAISVMF